MITLEWTRALPSWAQCLIVSAISYATWWMWAFIFKPILSPDEPKQYPYWIPFVGHAIAFSKDMNRTFDEAREYFGDTRAPFAVTVAGQVFYVITSPEDTNLVYRNTKTLTFNEFVAEILEGLGVTAAGVRNAFPQQPDSKTLAAHAQELYRIQFFSGQRAEDFWTSIHSSISRSMEFNAITSSAVIKADSNSATVSLWKWTRSTLFEAITRGLYGNVLFDLEPDLIQSFASFDANSWKIFHKYPRYAAKDTYEPLEKIKRMFQKYLQLPDAQRTDRAWVLQELETKFREFGMEGDDLALCLVMPFWVANSNGYKLCFWLLAFILQDPGLLDQIRDETREAVGMEANLAALHLEQCPKLVAAFNEALRLTASTATVRGIASDTPVGKVLLKAGNKVMIPYRQLHMNQEVWGSDATTFSAGRFTQNGKDLSKSPSFRPFGGGNTLCTGRNVAMKEILVFVTFAIHRLQIALPKGAQPSFDRVIGMFDQAMPTLGILQPLPGRDIEVVIYKN